MEQQDGEKQLLVGRDLDKAQFRQEVDAHRLILLTGDSGVGKTSLLEAGLVPELVTSGYTVAVCREWNWASSDRNPAEFLAAKVRRELEHEIPDLAEGAAVFWDLEARRTGRTVLVLDQFEELIRYSPSLTDRVFNLLLDLNHQTTIKVVISFRSEFLHRLRPLENQAKPFSISHYVLEEVDSSYALGVIKAANSGDSVAVTDAAAELIAKRWEEARTGTAQEDAANPFARVGLLHLQAFLYALHDNARGSVIDTDMLQDLQSGENAAVSFINGLRRSIDTKLDRCRKAANDVGVDPFLIEGTRQLLARSVKHLSSAGYKLVREATDLADSALERELETLRNGLRRSGEGNGNVGGDGALAPRQFGALLDQFVRSILRADETPELDLLGTDRRSIAQRVDDGYQSPDPFVSWEARLRIGAKPNVADPVEVTCGPMSGTAPANVLIEELRRFAFALAWLQESSLIRISTPGGGRVMVSLIHDGFGEALQQWSDEPLGESAGALHAITALSGAVNEWDLIGGDSASVYVNLRWRGAWIRSRFENVVFVNCDFRGSAFDGCSFTGVTFMNCLLDGVMFSDCSFLGAFRAGAENPVHASGARIIEPVFRVQEGVGDLAQTLAHYRATASGAGGLFSPLPGLPAIPADEEAGATTPWVAETGGLIIYGGRISSFVVRSCVASEESGMALRYVAGSGLDVVEHGTGRYEIFGSSLRHVTFTTAVEDEGRAFKIDVVGSVLVQVWIGENVRGEFHAHDCRLVHVWNDSPTVKAWITASPYHGLVDVEVDDKSKPMGEIASDFASDRLDADDAFSQSVRATDYRRKMALESPADGGDER